ncbi:MAG TPA: MBL fold metallo-hydrolase [Deltaproteobacteria bacterium]|nr:MBL fold metallo-hydrolase [Deltaproteobacteria bacterium]
MRPTFLARLVNGPLFDPVVFVRLLNTNRAVLFDCGRFEGLSNREILALDAVLVTHAHMDHFMGFDRILRTILHREEPLHVYGPEGIRDRVIARLGSYTWNLTGDYHLEITIHEVTDHEISVCSVSARDGFKPGETRSFRRDGTAIASRVRYTVDGVILDHNLPCLGFVLREPFHINIRSGALADRGYRSGPWIGELKDKLLAGNMGDEVAVATGAGSIRRKVEDLVQELVVTSPGQTVAYIADIRASDANIGRIERIAQGVDVLYIEAYYMSDREREALEKAHLTARQASLIARRLGARKVVPMHISPRYHHRVEEVMEELDAAKNGAQP